MVSFSVLGMQGLNRNLLLRFSPLLVSNLEINYVIVIMERTDQLMSSLTVTKYIN